MSNRLDEFREHRDTMNKRILQIDHRGIKRFFNLDTAAYREGALDTKTKELLGLVGSAVLRCNECIDYHLVQCTDAGWNDEELYDALNVSLVIGGSIVIPHLRHAVETIDLIRAGQAPSPTPDTHRSSLDQGRSSQIALKCKRG
jgi:AhpD family alkylhydroperoxidase